MEAIKIEHLYKWYDDNLVLEDINLNIHQRDFFGIIGPNGGGKTTLLKLILGLLTPDKGKITIFGDPPRKKNSHPIGYVPQYLDFDPAFPISVRDIVLMGRLEFRNKWIRRFTKKDKETVYETLSMVECEQLINKQFSELSGGQKQRVLIARAISSQPKILLLDEPTASVDTQTERGFYELLKKLHKELAIVIVSHDVGVISTYVEKIGCLNKKLITHETKEITRDMMDIMYNCPVEMIAHGIPHRVLKKHD